MTIIKEWSCAAHGFFDNTEPICPRGCKGEHFIQRAFLTPPSIGTARTKNIDKTLVGLANQFGLTDMNNQNGTGAVKRPDPTAANRMEEFNKMMQQRFGDPWQSVTPGGMQMPDGTIKGGDRGGGATAHIQGLGANEGSALQRDAAGQVSVPFADSGVSIPLSKTIKPDHIAGKFEGTDA